jgi:hypothetical protein
VFRIFIPAIPADKPKPTPLPLRDVFTDDHGKPQPRPTHERAKSYHDSATSAPPFKPFVDENNGVRTPFKVFSRPPEEGEHASPPATIQFSLRSRRSQNLPPPHLRHFRMSRRSSKSLLLPDHPHGPTLLLRYLMMKRRSSNNMRTTSNTTMKTTTASASTCRSIKSRKYTRTRQTTRIRFRSEVVLGSSL